MPGSPKPGGTRRGTRGRSRAPPDQRCADEGPPRPTTATGAEGDKGAFGMGSYRLTVPSGAPLTKRIIFRLSDAEAMRLRERAGGLGMSVSDFMRALVLAPIEFERAGAPVLDDVPSSRAGDAAIDFEPRDIDTATVEEVLAIVAAGGQPGARIAVSVGELARTRAALSKWGNNLNQSTEALNAIARLGRKTGFLTDGSRSEARYLMEQAATNSAAAARSVESISLRLSGLREGYFVPLRMQLAARPRN